MANRGSRAIRFNPIPARKPIEENGRNWCPQCGGLLSTARDGALRCFCGFVFHADPLPADWTMFVPEYSMSEFKAWRREQEAVR